jgi:hypothetical protein
MAQEGQAKARLILAPTRGFVIKPEDWKYSSARDFSGMQGLIDLSYTS